MRKLLFYTLLISLSFVMIFGISWLNSRSILEGQEHGSWQVLDNRNLYNYFNKNEEQKDFRVISITENPKRTFLYLNRINTFDGMRYNHSLNKSLFFSISLKILPDNMSTVRHRLRDHKNIDYKMLAMADIKYILSSKKINNNNLIFLEKIKINDMLTIFIYKNSEPNWGHVFIPDSQKFSDHKITNPNYYLDLKRLGFREILVPTEMNYENSDIKIIEYNLKNNIYHISLNGKKGPLVINQDISDNTYVNCNNKRLNMFKVNGIMTMIDIPESCKYLTVDINKKHTFYSKYFSRN